METMTVDQLYEAVRDGRVVSDIELQREIVYDDDRQRLVIDSLANGIPLPAFYLWQREDGTREVLDGKQRIEAIRRFYGNDLMYQNRIRQTTDQKTLETIDQTTLSVIVVSGDDGLKRETFNRINTLGVPLSQFEVLNGLYHGEYLRGLTKYVSQDKHAQKCLGDKGRGKRQIRCLKWLLTLYGLKTDRDTIASYVQSHQSDPFATDQKKVTRYVRFVATVFDDMGKADTWFSVARDHVDEMTMWQGRKTELNKAIRKCQRSTDWKLIANKNAELKDVCEAVMKGISTDPQRLFTAQQKQELLDTKTPDEHGRYQCADCGKWFAPDELTMDHVTPWSLGGPTELSNAQLLCRPCNSKKGNRQ